MFDKTIYVTNINWDTEDDGEVCPPSALGLPEDYSISYSMLEEDYGAPFENEDAMMDHVVEYLSNKFGYCIYGLDIEIGEERLSA